MGGIQNSMKPEDGRLEGCRFLVGTGGHARQILVECGDVFVVGVGDNGKRAMIVKQVEAAEVRVLWGVAAAESVLLTANAIIGRGTVILAGSCIGNAAAIGGHCILNHQCTVDHDVVLGNFVHVAPGARVLGAAMVGEGALIGANAVVLPGAVVPAWKIVRAGSVYPADYFDGDPSEILRLENDRHRRFLTLGKVQRPEDHNAETVIHDGD